MAEGETGMQFLHPAVWNLLQKAGIYNHNTLCISCGQEQPLDHRLCWFKCSEPCMMCGQAHPYESQYCPKIKANPTLLERFNRAWYRDHAGLNGLFPWEKGAANRMQEHVWNFNAKSPEDDAVDDDMGDDEYVILADVDVKEPTAILSDVLALIEDLKLQVKKNREDAQRYRVKAQRAIDEMKKLRQEVEALKAERQKPTNWSKDLLEVNVELTKLKLATDEIVGLKEQVKHLKKEVHDLTFNKRRTTDAVKHSNVINNKTTNNIVNYNVGDNSNSGNSSKVVKAPSDAPRTSQTNSSGRAGASSNASTAVFEFSFGWFRGASQSNPSPSQTTNSRQLRGSQNAHNSSSGKGA